MSLPEEGKKIMIEATENGPYLVKGLENLKNSKGEAISAKPTVYLCRCGGSSNKPFCDGTHSKVGFLGEKLSDGRKDKRNNYVGKEITVHDNRGVCAHIGNCTANLSSVFNSKAKPWIDANGAEAKTIIETVRSCPSGALSYSIDDVEGYEERDPTITVSKDGPYYVTGGVELEDEPRGEGASLEHYALCRCGGSKNKPFCDGTHWYIDFKDEKN